MFLFRLIFILASIASLSFQNNVLTLHTFKCGNSSVGRALASQAEGRGFEPRLPLFCKFEIPSHINPWMFRLVSHIKQQI